MLSESQEQINWHVHYCHNKATVTERVVHLEATFELNLNWRFKPMYAVSPI